MKEVLRARESYPKGPKGKVDRKKVEEWEKTILKRYRKIPENKILFITSKSWRSVVLDIVIERFNFTDRSYAYRKLKCAKEKKSN